MGLGKGVTYFEGVNIDRIDLVYAQAEGHNEQQGLPDGAAGRGILTLVGRIQRVGGTHSGWMNSQGKCTAHFF